VPENYARNAVVIGYNSLVFQPLEIFQVMHVAGIALMLEDWSMLYAAMSLSTRSFGAIVAVHSVTLAPNARLLPLHLVGGSG